MPEFGDLPPIEGRNDGLSLKDMRGEVSKVNSWDSWCVPCRVEIPLLFELVAAGSVPIHKINHKYAPVATIIAERNR